MNRRQSTPVLGHNCCILPWARYGQRIDKDLDGGTFTQATNKALLYFLGRNKKNQAYWDWLLKTLLTISTYAAFDQASYKRIDRSPVHKNARWENVVKII